MGSLLPLQKDFDSLNILFLDGMQKRVLEGKTFINPNVESYSTRASSKLMACSELKVDAGDKR